MEEGCDCEETRLRKQPAAPPAPDARLTALIEKWTAEADHYQDRAENGRMSDLARGEMIGLAAARRKDAADLEASLRAHEGEK